MKITRFAFQLLGQKHQFPFVLSLFLHLFSSIILAMITLSHAANALWIFLGSHEFEGPGENWISDAQVTGNGNIYVDGIYFVLTSFVTIGYGDIAPISVEEMLFTMAVEVNHMIIDNIDHLFDQIIGIGIFAYIMNTIRIIVEDFSKMGEPIGSIIGEEIDEWLLERERGNPLVGMPETLCDDMRTSLFYYERNDFASRMFQSMFYNGLSPILKQGVRKLEDFV